MGFAENDITLRTSLELLLGDTKRRTNKDEDRATIALIKAMEFHAGSDFPFLQETVYFQMLAGEPTYEATTTWTTYIDPITEEVVWLGSIPLGIQTVKTLQIRVGDNWWEPMGQVNQSEIRERYYNASTNGYPFIFSMYGNRLRVYSTPQSDFTSRMEYLRDPARPRYSFDGTSWIFEQPAFFSISDPTGPHPPAPQRASNSIVWQALSPEYKNDWLANAEGMIRAWAKWDLYNSYYKDSEAAGAAYLEYRQHYQDAKETRDRIAQGNIRLRATPI